MFRGICQIFSSAASRASAGGPDLRGQATSLTQLPPVANLYRGGLRPRLQLGPTSAMGRSGLL